MHRASLIPFATVLQSLDLREIDAVEHDLRRMQATESGLHRFVDLAVVRHGRFPAHAADETDNFHEDAAANGDERQMMPW